MGTSAKDGLAAGSDKDGRVLGSWCIGSRVQPVDGSMDCFLHSLTHQILLSCLGIRQTDMAYCTCSHQGCEDAPYPSYPLVNSVATSLDQYQRH
jgi:hypothetical protein